MLATASLGGCSGTISHAPSDAAVSDLVVIDTPPAEDAPVVDSPRGVDVPVVDVRPARDTPVVDAPPVVDASVVDMAPAVNPPKACAAGTIWPAAKRLILKRPPVSSAIRATNLSSNFCGVVPPSHSACMRQVTVAWACTASGAAAMNTKGIKSASPTDNQRHDVRWGWPW